MCSGSCVFVLVCKCEEDKRRVFIFTPLKENVVAKMKKSEHI